jgi:hypothetical protein
VTFTIILHIQNEDAVVGEVETLPAPIDTMVTIQNPRRLDGKELHYLADNVLQVSWPVYRLNFIEIVTPPEDEDIIGFVGE